MVRCYQIPPRPSIGLLEARKLHKSELAAGFQAEDDLITDLITDAKGFHCRLKAMVGHGVKKARVSGRLEEA